MPSKSLNPLVTASSFFQHEVEDDDNDGNESVADDSEFSVDPETMTVLEHTKLNSELLEEELVQGGFIHKDSNSFVIHNDSKILRGRYLFASRFRKKRSYR